MILTTKGRYAVMAVIQLALDSQTKAVTLASIASKQNISQGYLEQIFVKLKNSGIVVSTKGPGGGYKIGNMNATLKDVLDASQESVVITKCQNDVAKTCIPNSKCNAHNIWVGLNQLIDDYLSSISLSDIASSSTTVCTTIPLSNNA